MEGLYISLEIKPCWAKDRLRLHKLEYHLMLL